MKAHHHKMNICHAALAIFCLLNFKGFVDTANEPSTCYECKDNITDPSNPVPKCNRTQTKCPNNKTICGVITYQQSTGAVTYQERCLDDRVCANTSHCGSLKNCYIECCPGDLCNNFTNTNVSLNMAKPKAPTPTEAATPTKAPSAAAPTPTKAPSAPPTPTKAPSAPPTKAPAPTKAPSAKATAMVTPTKAPTKKIHVLKRPTCRENYASYLSMNPLLLLCILAVCFTALQKD